MAARQRAQNMLNHYVQLALKRAGCNVDNDTTSEIDEIVDDIIQATCEEVEHRMMTALKEGKVHGR